MEPFPLLADFPGIKADFSTRADGTMRLAKGEAGKVSEANRHEYFKKTGNDPAVTVGSFLSHGSDVYEAKRADGGSYVEGFDALVTKATGISLSITVADCLPVILLDPNAKVLGLAHAGWKGLESGILENTLAQMMRLGAELKDTVASIGPGIHVCHFEVKEDLVAKFQNHPEAFMHRDGKIFLDLPLIAKAQLLSLGLTPEHVTASLECTHCLPEKYFSYRRDKPETVEAMVAVARMLKDDEKAS